MDDLRDALDQLAAALRTVRVALTDLVLVWLLSTPARHWTRRYAATRLGWVVYWMDSVTVVMPRLDVIAHVLDDSCVCGPAVELLRDPPRISHHALDGRD